MVHTVFELLNGYVMSQAMPSDQIGQMVAYDEQLRMAGSSEHGDAFAQANPDIAKAMRALRDILSPPAAQDSFETISVEPNRLAPEVNVPERFQLIELLGRGGFGIVYRALDTWMKREVAIKFLRPELLTNERLRMRFVRESRAAARLNHPFIVRVWEAAESAQSTWQVCELVNGAPLTEHIALTKIEPYLAARLIRDLADGVAHAHTCNVLHRDIKPDNILLDCQPGDDLTTATLRLSDFGLARMTDLDETMLTCDGMLVGTPRYMAPEQLSGDVDTHGIGTDIYAIGVILYEMLAGHNPFEDCSSLQERMANVQEPVMPLRKAHPSLPKDLAVICHKCLEYAPEKRYATATELRVDLERFLRGEPTLARPLPLNEQMWRWSVRHRVAAGFLAVVFCAASLMLTQTLWNNSKYRQKNWELSQVNQQLAAKEQHARELAEIAEQLRLDATAEQKRFADLAWRKGVREAYAAWQRRDFAEANELLGKLAESHAYAAKRLEYRLLRAELDKHVKVLLKLPVAIHEVRCIPNSRQVAAAAGDGTVYILDGLSGDVIRTIQPGVKSLHALAISPDGSMLATGGVTDAEHFSYPCIYDIKTGQLIKKLPGQPTTIESLAFGTDSKTLACGCRYEEVNIFDLESEAVTKVPASSRHTSLSVSPKTNQLAVRNGTSHEVIKSLNRLSAEAVVHPREHFTSAWLPSGEGLLVATPYVAGTIIYTAENPPRKFSLGTVSRDSENRALATHARYLAASFVGGEVIVWLDEPMRDEPIAPYAAWRLALNSIDSMDLREHWLYVASQAGELIRVRIPDTRHATPHDELRLIQTYAFEGQLIKCVEWAASGEEALAGTWNSEISKIQLAPLVEFPELKEVGRASELILHRQVLAPKLDRDWVTNSEHISLAFSPNQKLWAYARDNELGVYNVGGTAQDPLFETALPRGSPCVKFSPDSTKLAWSTAKAVAIVDLTHPSSPPRTYELKGHGFCLAWSSDSQRLIVGGQFATIELDVNDLTTHEVDHGIHATCLAYDEHDQVISGHRDGTIRTIHRVTKETRVMKVHTTDVSSILLVPNSNIGFSLDSQANLGVWYTDGERIGLIQSDSNAYFADSTMRPKAHLTADNCLRVLTNDAESRLKVDGWILK